MVGEHRELRGVGGRRTDWAFAGISVVLIGDFCQIGPPKGVSLFEALVSFLATKKAKPNPSCDDTKVRHDAAMLFKRFKRADLTAQNRAKDDPAQSALLYRFSLDNVDPPLRPEDLARLAKQVITPALLRADPAFYDAPIACQTNVERAQFNKLQAIVFGKRHNEPIFRWVYKMRRQGDRKGTSDSAVPGDSRRSETFAKLGATTLEFYFVRGMPVVINVCLKGCHRSWEIANGRRGHAHSFSGSATAMKSPAELDFLQSNEVLSLK